MIDKSQMTEEEIKLNYITPSITEKWSKSCIRMEFLVAPGRIMLDGKKAKRKDASRADYVLFYKDTSAWFPLAVVEAKDNNHSPFGGMPQAIRYAKAMKVPFAFSSNGDSFVFHDMEKGTEIKDIPMDAFPSPDELWSRYRADNTDFTDDEASLLTTPYHYQDGFSKEPRYYQWIAINRVLAAIARGDKRMLIVLATGTGKTMVAFQIIWRLLQAKKVSRVLFLADRDILVSQPFSDDFSPLGGRMTRISKREMDTTHEVYLSLYHQLKNGEQNFYTAYDRDFFDLIIVDECHRGSADDGKYEEAITAFQELNGYKDSATQINKCNDAINDIKYNDALKMLEEGNPVEAYESMLALDGYKDSAEKADEIYNNYASVRFNGTKAGDTVFFGTYEQDNNKSNGKEKIEWEILEKEDDKVFVISKKALDCIPYNTLDASVTWEKCTLRSWLNADFYNSAFTEEEKNIIKLTNVVQESNPDFYTAAGKNTTDKIYLLSINEINKYYSSENARTCVPTKYADSQGANPSSENGCCWWWLRSPGYDSHSAASVYYDGTVSPIGFYVYSEHSAIRPVMWIDISK